MNERHAYKIPQLNKGGVIDSNVLEIEIPSTIDASFLDIIKVNTNANFLYSNTRYNLEKFDETNKKVTFFSNSLELWSDIKTISSTTPPTFVFELPTIYSPEDYSYTIEYRAAMNSPGSKYSGGTTVTSNLNELTITLNTEPGPRISYRITVKARKIYNVIGDILIVDFAGSTPVISSQRSALQGGGDSSGGIIIDDSLSETSTNPVQNKVITEALKKKAEVDAGYQFREDEILISNNDGDCLITGSGKALSDFVSKDERRTQSLVNLTEDNIAKVKEIITQNPATLIVYGDYIYAPTHNSDDIPSYYACCAADESILCYLIVHGEDEGIESGNFSLDEVGKKIYIDDLTQL